MYATNTNVQLKAIPASGYYFVRWQGTLTNESEAEKTTLIIPMTCTKQITAIFAPFIYRLNINIKPMGSGKLTIIPAIPADGYTAGTKVTITVLPNPGAKFSEWTGDYSSKESTAVVTMDRNKEITANFTQGKSSSLPFWLPIIVIGAVVVIGLVLLLLVRRRTHTKGT
jgi:hypothetical protein